MCVHDLLQPNTVANNIVTQCIELVEMVDAASGQGYAILDSGVVGAYGYLCLYLKCWCQCCTYQKARMMQV